MALRRIPAIGSAANAPVKLAVRFGHRRELDDSRSMATGVRSLLFAKEFCDVSLLCEETCFRAHKVVLAAKSEVLRGALGETSEVRIARINNPEAVKWMLDFIYEVPYNSETEYNPGSHEINLDVLRLAEMFKLPGLTQRAAMWMTRDLDTHNTVERLAACNEFGLQDLGDKILEQLTANKKALSEVTSSPAINAYPELMRDMLALIAMEPMDEPPKKKGRK